MDVQTLRAKIDALQPLADPDRASTPEHERAAAARMLTRFRKLLAEQTGERYGPADRRYGDKYADTRNLTLADVAKLIRAEVKLARKVATMTTTANAVKAFDPIGDAPTEIKVSVRTRYFSGGGAIDVRLSHIPAEWGWTEEPDEGYIDRRPRRVPTPALTAFAQAIKGVMDAYNYDGSDVTTDYFDKRFYGHVTFDSLLLA